MSEIVVTAFSQVRGVSEIVATGLIIEKRSAYDGCHWAFQRQEVSEPAVTGLFIDQKLVK